MNKDCTLGGKRIEYTPMEKDVLAMMQRTDFKNLSKSDVISFALMTVAGISASVLGGKFDFKLSKKS